MKIITYNNQNGNLKQKLLDRTPNNAKDAFESVQRILIDIKKNGLSAVLQYAYKFDGFNGYLGAMILTLIFAFVNLTGILSVEDIKNYLNEIQHADKTKVFIIVFVVLDMLLKRCVELGAHLAQPGEFSERAFINEKVDLAQAEAIADLIDSASEQAARSALRSL
jgi:hypothetical protein